MSSIDSRVVAQRRGQGKGGRGRRITSLALAAASLLGGGMLAGAASASASSIVDPSTDTAVYTLQGVASGSVLDTLGSTTGQVGVWSSNGGTNQQWSIVDSNGANIGYYTIQNQAGDCLDVQQNPAAGNADAVDAGCDGSSSQEWQINYQNESVFQADNTGLSQVAQIVNKQSGQYLVNYYGFNGAQALVGGADVVQAGPSFDNDWTLTRSTGGVPVVFGSGNGNEVIDVPNVTTAWGTQLDVWQANGGDNQRWYLQRAANLGNGYPGGVDVYRIISVYGNDWNDARCLEASGANPQIGATVEQYGCDPNWMNQANQLWIVNGAPIPDAPPGESPGWVNLDQFSGGEAVAGINLVNLAMLNLPNPTFAPPSALDAGPVIAESSTFTAQNGSTLTMQPVNSLNSGWAIYPISTTTSSSSGSSGGSPCSVFACLDSL
jgi:Ricin-type beta-trefoil lectin domain-like